MGADSKAENAVWTATHLRIAFAYEIAFEVERGQLLVTCRQTSNGVVLHLGVITKAKNGRPDGTYLVSLLGPLGFVPARTTYQAPAFVVRVGLVHVDGKRGQEVLIRRSTFKAD